MGKPGTPDESSGEVAGDGGGGVTGAYGGAFGDDGINFVLKNKKAIKLLSSGSGKTDPATGKYSFSWPDTVPPMLRTNMCPPE